MKEELTGTLIYFGRLHSCKLLSRSHVRARKRSPVFCKYNCNCSLWFYDYCRNLTWGYQSVLKI
jgi:hypothetical protein